MALIKCPECGKEISDKAVSCPNCGNPLNNNSDEILNTQETTAINKGVHTETKNNNTKNKRILIIVISIVAIIMVGVICFMLTNAPNKEYEAKAAQCISSVQQVLKNPDSLQVREMNFYNNNLKDDVASNDLTDSLIKLIGDDDVCVMKYSAQNGFGGNGFNYAFLIYSKESDKYYILGTTDTLDEDKVDKDDENICLIINFVIDNLKPACTFDMDQSMSILKKHS